MSSSCKTYLLSPLPEGLRDTFTPTTVRNKHMREAPASLNSSLVTLLCKSEITAGTAPLNWDLYREEYSGRWGDRAQMLALNCQSPGGHGYCHGQQGQSSSQNCLALRDL